MAHIYSDNFELLHSVFPNVIYGDRTKEAEALGRTFLAPETTPVIFYSDKGTVLKGGPDCLYTAMQNADYMINIAALKAHACAGITLMAKNHFGSITEKRLPVCIRVLLVTRMIIPTGLIMVCTVFRST